MTRDEAIKAYADAAHDCRLEYYDETRRKAEVAIRCLEAIGLIKFDEPKTDDAARDVTQGVAYESEIAQNIVDAAKKLTGRFPSYVEWPYEIKVK